MKNAVARVRRVVENRRVIVVVYEDIQSGVYPEPDVHTYLRFRFSLRKDNPSSL